MQDRCDRSTQRVVAHLLFRPLKAVPVRPSRIKSIILHTVVLQEFKMAQRINHLVIALPLTGQENKQGKNNVPPKIACLTDEQPSVPDELDTKTSKGKGKGTRYPKSLTDVTGLTQEQKLKVQKQKKEFQERKEVAYAWAMQMYSYLEATGEPGKSNAEIAATMAKDKYDIDVKVGTLQMLKRKGRLTIKPPGGGRPPCYIFGRA